MGWAKGLDITPGGGLTTPLAVAAPAAASAADNTSRGQAVFNPCKACHSLVAGNHKIGPSLHGLFGRRAGSAPDFLRYSQAIQEADIVWTEATLRAYLKAPSTYVPGTNMPFSGIKSDNELDEIMIFLKQNTGGKS